MDIDSMASISPMKIQSTRNCLMSERSLLEALPLEVLATEAAMKPTWYPPSPPSSLETHLSLDEEFELATRHFGSRSRVLVQHNDQVVVFKKATMVVIDN
ncbi:hypothetical protein E3N88_18892 [Mikania micrantha]|uniref:Uncharacterized protein n=1 Tax=Mikania micrantha TaxID=192012 RepID=A0A5N6NLN1_9ASTR|nr:hypothetical protein E3N88_18892 [Mikania micrantha]